MVSMYDRNMYWKIRTHYCVYVLCFVWTVFAIDSKRVLSADTIRTADSLAQGDGGATFLH
jgi:hypothetical protein